MYSYFISSSFLFLYGDDRWIHYTRAYVDTDDAEDAQATKWGLAWGIRARRFFAIFYYVFSYE